MIINKMNQAQISFFNTFMLLLFMIILKSNVLSQVQVDINGTRLGGVFSVLPLVTPFVSTPNQSPVNYYPLWFKGPVKVITPPSNSDIDFENYTNTYGGGPFNEPLLRGQWGNTAWLGSPHHVWWQVRTNELWVNGNQITSSDVRFKRNIIDHPSVINQLMQLRTVMYDKIELNENTPAEKRVIIDERNKNHHGLIAQEIANVFPE